MSSREASRDEKERLHKLAIYSQMIDLYPNEPKYLRRYIELLLQLGREQEALTRMRQLERMYRRQGNEQDVRAIQQIREGIQGAQTESTHTLNPVLSDVNPAALNMLMRGARRKRLVEGQHLIRQDDMDEEMYIVLSGELAVMVCYPRRSKPVLVHLLGEGEIVGETAFLEGGARSASVVANSKASVLALNPKRVLQCLLQYPEIGEKLRAESQCRQRLTMINGNAWLARLPIEDKRELAQSSKVVRYEPFKIVRRAGSSQGWVGIVDKGLIRIVAEDRDGKSHILEPIRAGDMVGEMAALREETMPADMVTVSETRMLQMPLAAFQQAMSRNPKVRNRIIEQAAEKVASTMMRIQKSTRV